MVSVFEKKSPPSALIIKKNLAFFKRNLSKVYEFNIIKRKGYINVKKQKKKEREEKKP